MYNTRYNNIGEKVLKDLTNIVQKLAVTRGDARKMAE